MADSNRDLETSLFLHGFPFELELINNEFKCGPLHALMRHFSEFQPYLGALTDEQTAVIEAFKRTTNANLNDNVNEANRKILIEMQMKIVLFIKDTIHYNEHKRQYPIHKSGNKDKTLVTCWKIENSTNRLVLAISGWKGYFTGISANVVEKRALVTSYLITESQFVTRYSNLRYWFDDAGMVRIANCKDFRNELGVKNGVQKEEREINPFPLLNNIIDRTDVEFLPYLFKEQISELLDVPQPGYVRTYLSTLHFGVLIEQQQLSGCNVPPHWRELPRVHEGFNVIIAFQFPLQGMLYTILRFGNVLKYLEFMNTDIIDINNIKMDVKNCIETLRTKKRTYRKFHRWYAENLNFVDFSEFLQENEEVLQLQGKALDNMRFIFERPVYFLEWKEEKNDQMKGVWKVPGQENLTMSLILSKENLAEKNTDKPFRKVLRIEFENLKKKEPLEDSFDNNCN